MSTFFYVPQYFTTQLSVAGGIDDTQTTGIVLQDISGVDATKPGIIALTWSNPIDTSKVEYVFYTSINESTKECQGVTRGQEGYSAKSHLNGATVAWPLSKSHINNIPDSTTTFTNKDLTSETNTFANIVYTNSLARQAIINGNFDVWQRGTTKTITTNITDFLTDRWKIAVNQDSGTLPSIVVSRQLLTSGDIPNAFYHYRTAPNGAGSSFGNGAFDNISQYVENGTRLLAGYGKKVTLSFYARASVAGKRLGLSLRQNYGTGGSPTAEEIITGEIITLTSSWVKYTKTFTTNTLAGKTFGTANDDYLRCIFWQMWGTTIATAQFGGGTAETYGGNGTIDIAQVQLCAGDVALPFMPKSYEEELRACQRYCQTFTGDSSIPIAIGSAATTTIALLYLKLITTMRIAPTITATAGDWQLQDGVNEDVDLTAISIQPNTSGTDTLQIRAEVASGLTQYRTYILIPDQANRLMIFSSEV